jgi:RND family efflux transporter MFP subunit
LGIDTDGQVGKMLRQVWKSGCGSLSIMQKRELRVIMLISEFARRGSYVAAFLVMVGWGSSLNVTAQAAESVTTAPVIPMRIGDETRVSGTVIPFKEVTLSAQLPGEVKYLAGREGNKFKAGTVIVAIDDENIRAKRRAAVASYRAAQSALYNARIQYNRELWSPKTGKSTGMGFPMMMDDFFGGFQGQKAGVNRPWVDRYANIQGQAQGVRGAQSRLVAARAQIDELDAKLRDAQLKVPFDGKILAKLVEIGDTVQPGQPLIKFGFTDYLRIQAEIPVRLISSLKIGMVVDAHIDVAGGQKVPARVAQIYPMADPQSHTVTVKFDLPTTVPNSQGKQVPFPGGPGMYAEIIVSDIHKKALWVPTVPASSIVTRGSLKAVIVRQKDGKSSLRMVRLGDPVEGGRVAVLSGLKGDEQVITGPPEKLSTMQSGVSTSSSNGASGG